MATVNNQSPASLFLLSAKSHARLACSVASALATARGRYHLFPGGGRGVARLDERPGFYVAFLALVEHPEGGAAAGREAS